MNDGQSHESRPNTGGAWLRRLISRQGRPDLKWLLFDRLYDALSADGCAICTIVARQCVRQMEILFTEGIMDPDTRQVLHASLGLCNAHGWMATRIPLADAGLAIVSSDLIARLLPHLIELAQSRKESYASRLAARLWHRPVPTVLATTARCPICAANEQTARVYLRELLSFFDDPDLRATYDQSFGVCLPHLEQALREFPDEQQLPALLAAEREKLVALESELQDYNRRRDYGFRDEPKGREQSSWWRVVEKFTGKRQRSDRTNTNE